MVRRLRWPVHPELLLLLLLPFSSSGFYFFTRLLQAATSSPAEIRETVGKLATVGFGTVGFGTVGHAAFALQARLKRAWKAMMKVGLRKRRKLEVLLSISKLYFEEEGMCEGRKG
jgi:hypothetical protein